MAIEKIKAPDLGGAENVEIIEVCVSAGDTVEAEDSLVVVESDKASMEIPAPKAGKVVAVLVNEGDSLNEGDVILELEAEEGGAEAEAPVEPAPEVKEEASVEETPAPVVDPQVSSIQSYNIPDIGGDSAEVIEVCVAVGDEVEEGDSLIVLESDKASMEVPSPATGTIKAILINEGDTASAGLPLVEMEIQGSGVPAVKPEDIPMPTPAADAKQKITEPKQVTEKHQPVHGMTESRPTGDVYAGPSVRKLAREIGVDLAIVPGTGPRGRIQKADVKAFIKDALANKGVGQATVGAGIPQVPEIDFAQFGDIRLEKMSKLHKVTAANMHRSWLNVPHVTAFDDVDITDLEEFRGSLKKEAEKAGVKITPLPFLLKALAKALMAHPKMNSSLHADGEHLVYKDYVHIGMAVDTPAGLMVPVIRDVDKKSIFELAAETVELAQKAKDRKLKPQEMQGGTFTISSLGAMGGTGFTPIVNTPEVAILGVSKLSVKPVWDGANFVPKKMLPLSLSYDHRVVNGADAGRFFVFLNSILQDYRRLAL
ncbi:MAG: dihydrolipoyllysine-residue acetyltransferase [Cellvibrionales bacterium]|nr:dihydrolipoyllysine-residue acetyltransferase [Cellvibrionales bacterium]